MSKKSELDFTATPELIEPVITRLALKDTKYLDLLARHFEPQWFENESLGHIIDMAVKFYKKYAKIPSKETMDILLTKTIKDTEKCKDALKVLENNYQLSTNFETNFIDNEIVHYLIRQGVHWIILSNIDEIKRKENVDKFIESMREISSMGFDTDLGLFFLKNFEEVVDYLSNPLQTFTTGYDSIDKLFNGGWPSKGRNLIVFSAQVHMGKSLMMSNLAAKLIKEGKFVLIVTLEMCEMVYAKRVTANLTKDNINLLHYNLDNIKGCVEAIRTEYPDSEILIKEYPPSTLTPNGLKTFIDRIIATVGRKPDIVFVDYLTLMQPCGEIKADNIYLKGGNIAKGLRALSYIFEIPFVTASQINRGNFNSEDADLDSMSQSIQISEDADVVLNLFQKDGDKEAGILRMKVLKNRLGGQIGKKMEFDINYTNLCVDDVDEDRITGDRQEMIDDVVEDVIGKV